MTLHLLFVILAAVCFVLAATNVPSSRINIVALGLLFFLLAVAL